MRRNLLLILAVVVSVLLVVNSTKKIMTFRTTSQKVEELEARLAKLRQEKEDLKRELEYKKTDEFAEAEIRNKLGLAKEGEQVFVVPKKNEPTADSNQPTAEESKWQKWWNLFFGG